MFSDLVGSTALSTRLDPEDLRDVIAVYQRCVEEIVRRFDGFVAKFMGDGVLVYFGYPEAHEDDPEQAVRAGLELVAVTDRELADIGITRSDTARSGHVRQIQSQRHENVCSDDHCLCVPVWLLGGDISYLGRHLVMA
jgi:class 3 adenylate cyclase